MLEFSPDLGMPHTKALGNGLFELRLKGQEGIARLFYCTPTGQRIVMLHGYIKKAQKIPLRVLKMARRCMLEGRTVDHTELKARLLTKPKTRSIYEDLADEFDLLRQVLAVRRGARLTQTQVAERMEMKPAAIARLESALVTGKPSPSLATLRRYAKVLGYKLEIRLTQPQGDVSSRRSVHSLS